MFIPTRMRLVGVIAQIAFCLVLQGCGPKASSPLTQPHRDVPFSAQPPKDASEWTRLTRELDDARAENQRKDAELQAALKAKEAANFDTWKRFGVYSYALTALGIALLIASILPWTAPFFGGMRGVSMLLIGGGILFGAMPHILETYGPLAFYPIGATAGLYVLAIAVLDIVKRIRNARAEAHVCAAALDPAKPEVGVRDVIDVRMAHNPAFAAEIEKVMP